MGLLDLMRFMSTHGQRQQRRRRRQALAPHAHDGLIAPRAKRKGSPCQLDDDSQASEIEMYSGPSLPEDVWRHIHSLMPMRDAARAACVSRAFLCSWRCHPELNFDTESLGLGASGIINFDIESLLLLGKRGSRNNGIAKDFSSKVDQILEKHSGIGVKRLKIDLVSYNQKDSCYLNHWLRIAVTPGIEKLDLLMPMGSKYSFPWPLLCNAGNSIRSVNLAHCSLSPTAELGLLTRLTRLRLHDVRIMADELGRLLSSSFALEQLEISFCKRIVCLKVPCSLLRLRYLEVQECDRLEMIDIEAPNIYSFCFNGDGNIHLSLGENLQMKDIRMFSHEAVHYARVELPSSVPYLETLYINSFIEVANVPMLHSKFLHLKNLRIVFHDVPFTYDYFSLVSFLDACPSLEDFVLDIFLWRMGTISIFTDDSNLRQIREHHHHNIKRVEITGFFSAKSLVELTRHVVQSALSLECLTLDTTPCQMTCSDPENKSGKCLPFDKDSFREAHRAVLAIRKYIKPKVPSTIMLDVVEPCIRCSDVVTFKGRHKGRHRTKY